MKVLLSLKTIVSTATIALLTISSAYSSILVEYDFTGQNGIQASTAATSVASNLTAGDITRGANYGPMPASAAFTNNGMVFAPGLTNSVEALRTAAYTLDTAIANNAFFEITLTVQTGYQLTIDSILMGTRRASTNTGPNSFTVRSSLDNYTTDLVLAVSAAGQGGNDSNDRLLVFSSLENITGTVTLRFYGYGRGQTNTTYGQWVISNPSTGNFSIYGTLSQIPEPTAPMLLFMGIFFLLISMRRINSVKPLRS